MGLTERHWFENEDVPENYEWALEDSVHMEKGGEAGMSYKSPIDIVLGEFQTHVEGEIIKAVRSVGVNVDKDELLKALKYDRDQYEQGYRDGLRAGAEMVQSVNWIPGDIPVPCSVEKDGKGCRSIGEYKDYEPKE